jgi:alpha-1,3-mannosyltransferase
VNLKTAVERPRRHCNGKDLMRVVHVVRQFFPSVGGLEAVVMELAHAQAAHGHEVGVVTLDRIFKAKPQVRLPAAETVSGIAVDRIPFFGSTRYPIAPSVLKFIGSADIVHVHAIDFFFDYLAWTKPFHRKPLVASTHGAFFHTSFAAKLKRIYFRTVTRLSAACYDAIVAVSVADEELFSTISKKVVCIENGVNVGRFLDASAQVPKKAIISIGRFSSNKRLDRLVTFFAKLQARDPEWKLTIAGRQSDLSAADVRLLVERASFGSGVKIVESPSDEALRALMGDCSVLASASEYEGFGLTAVEGMAAGMFPLLSDIPAFRHLVAKTGLGLIVDFKDPDAAAAKFAQAWTQVAGRYAQQRKAAIAGAQQYEWGPVAASYEQIYEKILAGRKA